MAQFTPNALRASRGADRFSRRLRRSVTVGLAVSALAGCAATAIDGNADSVNAYARQHLSSEVKWLATEDARRQAKADADAALAKPLDQDDAVRLALGYSPAFQALFSDRAAASADATQSARWPNPVFSFERLARSEGGVRELDITRALSVSLFDLLRLPQRLQMADAQQQRLRVMLAADAVRAAGDARTAWVRAVAAHQSLVYFRQVKSAADASADLANRMQAAGNFSKLQRMREQAFSAQAVADLARAEQSASNTREALVRALGLDSAQAAALTLPDRLPDLPAAPKPEAQTAQSALDERLDVQMARAQLDLVAREQGLTRVSSVVNGFDIGGVRKTQTGLATERGYQLQMPLPIFDTGDARRAGAQARYTAALHRTAQVGVDAASQLRQTHAAYQAAYSLARHYRDEVVPLRRAISDENLLLYNGMSISVFELLADARVQIAAVVQAIDAQRDFWLASAALDAAMLGQPIGGLDMTPDAAREQ